MSSPSFPAAATLLNAKVCPPDRFDALFAKITRERRITDGYFLQTHPDEATVLFVVNASPFSAGRLRAKEFSSTEIREFFAAYARHPESPLSFFVADKRLLLGLMVLFRHRTAQQFPTDIVALETVLEDLATRAGDAILAIGSEDDWAIGILNKGKPVATYLPASGAEASKEITLTDRLLTFARTRPPGEVTVAVMEETRVTPAGDARLVTPETHGRLGEVFLRAAAKIQEEEASSPREAEASPALEIIAQPEPIPTVESEPEAIVAPKVTAEPEAPAESVQAPLAEGEGLRASAVDAAAAAEKLPVSPEVAAPASEAVSPPLPKGPAPEIDLLIGDRPLGTFSLARGELTIGRNPGNDIPIENAGVSRRHAVIKWTGGRAILEDLGSANGTSVNGKRVTSQDLRDGDEITIVKHRLIFRLPKEGEAPTLEAAAGQKTMYIDSSAIAQAMAGKSSARSDTATPVLRPRLILPDLKKFALESEEITLGSGSGCQIQLPGMFVAKVHARILPQQDGQYKLVHVAGLTGTRVNGEKITTHVLKHGDEVEIGKSKLLFRLER